MAVHCDLVAIAIVEKDVAGDAMLVWSFPALSDEQRAWVAQHDARGDLDGKAHVGRVHDCWVYMQSTVTGLPNESLPRVGGFCVYLFAREFHPPKFGALVEVATTTYRATGEPTRVLEVYLGAFTLGKCSTDHGSWAVASFAAGSPLMGANAKALVRQFGDATILLWAAMVLKKRVLCYGEDRSAVEACTCAMPLLAWHRQSWDPLRPLVVNVEGDLKQLREAGVFCAGTTSQELTGAAELVDLLVDLTSNSVRVMDHAKADFALTSLHKDVARVMLEAAAADNERFVQALTSKTKEIVARLREAGGERGAVTPATLEERGVGKAAVHFLYSLALAEQLTAK